MHITSLTLLLLFNYFLAFGQEDCIFNNEFKNLTQEWINNSQTDLKFQWVEEANTSLNPQAMYLELE